MVKYLSNWEPAVNRQPWLPPGTRKASSCNAGAAISHCARAGAVSWKRTWRRKRSEGKAYVEKIIHIPDPVE
eukprot:7994435-Pyramimonas_sp.AAC.1